MNYDFEKTKKKTLLQVGSCNQILFTDRWRSTIRQQSFVCNLVFMFVCLQVLVWFLHPLWVRKRLQHLWNKRGLVSCMNEKKVATLNPQRESLLTWCMSERWWFTHFSRECLLGSCMSKGWTFSQSWECLLKIIYGKEKGCCLRER
jgi:hypothetical protein